MQTIWQDLRYGFRGLASRPSFALLAVLNLALGIGAATTIFSVIQNVLLDPFPYADARRVAMIQIHDTTSSRPGGRSFFQVPEFLELQSQNHVFEDVIGGTNQDVMEGTVMVGLPVGKNFELRPEFRIDHLGQSATFTSNGKSDQITGTVAALTYF